MLLFQPAKTDQEIIGRLQCRLEILARSIRLVVKKAVSGPLVGNELTFTPRRHHKFTEALGLFNLHRRIRHAMLNQRRRHALGDMLHW